jgi:hypothetical protein
MPARFCLLVYKQSNILTFYEPTFTEILNGEKVVIISKTYWPIGIITVLYLNHEKCCFLWPFQVLPRVLTEVFLLLLYNDIK